MPEAAKPQSPLILSVRQPWAWLLIRPDIVGDETRAAAYAAGLIKDVENRNWSTKVRGSRVLIHASKGMTRVEYDYACMWVLRAVSRDIIIPEYRDLPRGGIVGSAILSDCVSRSSSLWFQGDYGFVMQDAQPLPFQPCRGSLGFFRLQPNMDAARVNCSCM